MRFGGWEVRGGVVGWRVGVGGRCGVGGGAGGVGGERWEVGSGDGGERGVLGSTR